MLLFLVYFDFLHVLCLILSVTSQAKMKSGCSNMTREERNMQKMQLCKSEAVQMHA
jgi:hypothetical protein